MLVKLLAIFSCLINSKIKCDGNWYDRRPTVRIRQGLLEGIKTYTESSKPVDAYLGIPYALPPVGEYRFTPPRKHPGWNGTYQAVNYGQSCSQLQKKSQIRGREDCLYLNVWIPENAKFYAPLPVVIFLEGHDFVKSSSFPIYGQDLATEGIVVVTVNYRLNIFGFFCLGNSRARGNFGLLDQYVALLWVKENIKQFGGDSNKITLFGHSSGAVSVMLHMVSPRTAGLFQRVIVASGSVTAKWHSANNPIVASREVIRILSCNTYTVDPVSCLKTKSTEDILRAFEEYSESYSWIDSFSPVVDNFLPAANRYLPDDPTTILKNESYLQVPVLTGISKPITDPQYVQWVELSSKGYMQLQEYIEKAKIPEIIRQYRFSTASKDTIYDLIKWKYLSYYKADTRLLYEQLKKLEFEAKIEAPHFMQLSYLISSYVQPIYVYFIDDMNITVNTTDSTITPDLLLLFGPLLMNQLARRRFNSYELRISKQLKQFWTDFITFGNPTPNINQRPWRKYTSIDSYIEDFGTSSINSIQERSKLIQRTKFWNQLLSQLSQVKYNLTNTVPKELQNSPDPAAGFRHALYTLVGLAIALLALLLVCIFLLKKKSKERESHLHMGY